MLIGVLSDTHDNMDNIRKIMERFVSAPVEAVVHCGDLVAPFTLPELLKPGFRVHAVFGNNDGERVGLFNRMQASELGSIVPGPIQLELGGRNIIVNHEPLPDGLLTAAVDAVLTGHTHEPVLKPGRPLILNPGEGCGLITGRATAALLDLETMHAEIFTI